MSSRLRRRSIFGRQRSPVFVSVGSETVTSDSSLSSISVGAPTDYQSGDLLIMDVRIHYQNNDSGDPGNVVSQVPSGWTELATATDGQTGASGYSRVNLKMFAKIADGTESFPVTVSRNHAPNGGGSYGFGGSVRVYRGVGNFVGASTQGQGALGVRYNPALSLSIPANGILISSGSVKGLNSAINLFAANGATIRSQSIVRSAITLTDTATAPSTVSVPRFDFVGTSVDWCAIHVRYNGR